MAGKIIRVSGPTLHASDMKGCFMHEMVSIGEGGLQGEIIKIEGDVAAVQVYEDTIGLKVGDIVESTGELLSVELGPGLIGSIFDGIQRPLVALYEQWGNFIRKGAKVSALDRERKWEFFPSVQAGDLIKPGMLLGSVRETSTILHKILTPIEVEGVVKEIDSGKFTVTEPVAVLEDGRELTLSHKWNIRQPRPSAGRLSSNIPMITGQRILDTLFPVAEGGSAIIPGGFGTGKTVLEQTLAMFANADIVIYVGCGERGNEMAEVLRKFPELIDPYSGKPLMERTILIGNTSNMPVAAREASIYTGMTMAEYYRDMGYRVALMADSTSRWAEALREISSRMEEMPGEEGYPSYLPSRLGLFYERAGRMRCLGRPDEVGVITIIGAVSPPGGDFSEPVTQASMRLASTFWALDYDLAHKRHFPAINWHGSFSLSYPNLIKWYTDNVDSDWRETVAEVHSILQKEEELAEMAKIVGVDALGDHERVEMETARLLREGYLRQSSYQPNDAFCSHGRQHKMLSILLYYIRTITAAVKEGVSADYILAAPMVERLLRLKEIPEKQIEKEIEALTGEIADYIGKGASR